MIDINEMDRLHGEAVANKGGNFEVDTDEAFRIWVHGARARDLA